MKITHVTVRYSRLVSDRDTFGNRNYGCELSADVENQESVYDVRDTLLADCRQFVESQIAEHDIIVVSKEKAAKLRECVKAIQAVNESDLPF